MTLQTSGAISLLDIQNEFGGSSPTKISEYYRNGSYVPGTYYFKGGSYAINTSVPTSGTIDLADFYGTADI